MSVHLAVALGPVHLAFAFGSPIEPDLGPDLLDADGDLWRARPDGAYSHVLSAAEIAARYGPVCKAPMIPDP